jgi:CheY-like chemotaxis protein
MPMPGTHKLPITILICDDDEDERLRTQQTLEDARISNSLRFVEGGAELLDYLYQRGTFAGETGAAPRPGLILLGLNASMLDGEEALRQISQAPTLFDIPIVGVTTSSLDDVVAHSAWRGVSSVTTKPVTFSGLMEAMNLLGRYWLEIVELSQRPL